MQRHICTTSRRTLLSAGLGLLGLVGLPQLMLTTVFAENTNYQICVPSVTWFANGSTSPVIDGCITNCAASDDPGWRGAFRYDFDNATNGTPQPTVTVFTVRDASNIYLGFEYYTQQAPASTEAILIGLDPTGNAADQRLIILYPYTNGGSSTNSGPLADPTYYIGASNFPTATSNGTAVSALPVWLKKGTANLKIDDTPSGSAYFYSVELQIPITGTDAIPAPSNGSAGNLGLYLNTIRIIGGGAAESAWPTYPDTPAASQFLVPPPISTWGVGSFNGLCSGVSVASITANGGTTQLNLNTPNNFVVTVQNSTRSSEGFANSPPGTAVLAPQITPKLTMGYFGVPYMGRSNSSEPIDCGANCNPAPPQDIPASSTATYNIGPWNISSEPTAEQNDIQQFQHWCVMARLSSAGPAKDPSCGTATQTPWCYHAYIPSDAAIVNMNFPSVPSGKMYRGPLAQIATRGYELMPDNQQTFILQARTADIARAYRPGLTRATTTNPEQTLLWALHAYRQLNQTITIKGKTYPILQSAGAFGYQLTYEAANPQWRYQFFAENGQKLETLDANTFKMAIPQDKVGFVNATFEGDPAAGTGGPVNPGGGGGTGGGSHLPWWIILLIILILLLVLFLMMRRKTA